MYLFTYLTLTFSNQFKKQISPTVRKQSATNKIYIVISVCWSEPIAYPSRGRGIILGLDDVGLALDSIDHHQYGKQEGRQNSHSSKQHSTLQNSTDNRYTYINIIHPSQYRTVQNSEEKMNAHITRRI